MNLNRCLFGLVFLVAIGQGVSARAGLVGQWLFEEGAGTTAFDTSSFGRDGAITNGATYVAGLYAGSQTALQMNSAGPNSPNLAAAQSVLLPSDANYIRNAPGATLAAWIRLDGSVTNDRAILSVANGLMGTSAPRANLGVTTVAGTPRLIANGSKLDGNTASGQISATELVIGQTYFVVGVLDFVNGSASVYINGVQDGFSVIPGWNGNSADTANRFAEIGSNANPTAADRRYFPGVIDGVRIFNRALSASEVQQIYQFPDSVPEPASAAALIVGVLLCVASGGRRRS